MNMQRWGAAAMVGVFLLATGCAPDPASAEPITLRVGTDDSPGVPAADQIEEFARQVDRLSEGTLTIEPVWHAAGDTEDWDQAVAELVIDGSLEMALVPSRAWDVLGVTSLQPLQAPFLITSTEHLDDVVTSELAGPLMAGLSGAGVRGLALYPEGLRRPFGFDDPVLGPGDYAGGTVRVPTSNVSTRMFEVLGADTTDAENDPETMLARESSLMLSAGGATVTGDVAFYPKVNVLVIGEDIFDRLNDRQREVLTEAAIAAQDAVIADAPTESELAEAFCAAGGIIVLAGPEEVGALRGATQPIVQEIASHPGNAELVEAIGALAPASGDETAPPCGGERDAGSQNAALNGTYRWEMTEQEYRDNGITESEYIQGNIGVFTWTFADGEWSYVQVSTASGVTEDYEESGTYDFDGETLLLRFADGPESYRVVMDATGSLTLTPVEVPERKFEVWASANVWERIG